VVSRHNIEMIRERVRNGMNNHPGANFVRFKSGSTQYLKYGDRRRVASELKFGDIVERQGLTLVQFSAQRAPFLTQNTP